MKVTETTLKGCFILEPSVFKDSRGYFSETFNERTFNRLAGTQTHFVQDNQSFSKQGVIRGLHYQTGDAAQAKLVRVVTGSVYDVAVDLRQGSPTFGQHTGIVLTAENNKQLFIPRGFAHGFSVLSPEAVFCYKCDNFYNKDAEAGIIYNDGYLNIDWMVDGLGAIVSEKDLELPSFDKAEYFR